MQILPCMLLWGLRGAESKSAVCNAENGYECLKTAKFKMAATMGLKYTNVHICIAEHSINLNKICLSIFQTLKIHCRNQFDNKTRVNRQIQAGRNCNCAVKISIYIYIERESIYIYIYMTKHGTNMNSICFWMSQTSDMGIHFGTHVRDKLWWNPRWLTSQG